MSWRLCRLARLPSSASSMGDTRLMAIPPYCPDPEEVRPYFREMVELAARIAELKSEGVTMAELSMGMSHDFEVAIEEGATLVRVGSAIFGARG